jgi:hypothetical protein
MTARILSIVTVALLLGALVPAAALGDGDPASDTLLGENVFYPYQPPVAKAAQTALNAATAAAKAQGFPIKVALIGRPLDLGVIPDLFGKPEAYAKFLDQEISFQGKQPLLVVMAAGYGTSGLPAPAVSAVASLATPAGTSPTQLAQAATKAVAKLAAADGHRLKGVAGDSDAGGSSSLPLIIALAAAALIVSAALVILRRRQPAHSQR